MVVTRHLGLTGTCGLVAHILTVTLASCTEPGPVLRAVGLELEHTNDLVITVIRFVQYKNSEF